MYILRIFLVLSVLFSSKIHAQDIYESCRKGNIDQIQKLYAMNMDTINKPNKNGYTPLIIAGYRNQLEAVKILLSLGANVNASSEDGTVLTAACYKSNIDLVKILLANKADVNVKNNAGTTPLMFAIMAENEGLVKLLIEHGADINAKDNSNKTIYQFAENCENLDIKKLFTK